MQSPLNDSTAELLSFLQSFRFDDVAAPTNPMRTSSSQRSSPVRAASSSQSLSALSTMLSEQSMMVDALRGQVEELKGEAAAAKALRRHNRDLEHRLREVDAVASHADQRVTDAEGSFERVADINVGLVEAMRTCEQRLHSAREAQDKEGAQLKELLAAKEEQERRYAGLQSRYLALRRNTAAGKEEADKLAQEAETLRQIRNVLEQRVQEVEADNARLQADVQALGPLRQCATQAEEEKAAILRGHEDAVASLERVTAQAQETKAELEASLRQCQEKVGRFAATVETDAAFMRRLSATLRSATQRIRGDLLNADSGNAVSAASTMPAGVRPQSQGFEEMDRVEAVADARSALEATVQSLTKTVGDAMTRVQGDVTELQRRLRKARFEALAHGRELQEAAERESREDELVAELRETQEQQASTAEEVERLRFQVEALRQARDEKAGVESRLRDRMLALSQELADQRERHAAREAELSIELECRAGVVDRQNQLLGHLEQRLEMSSGIHRLQTVQDDLQELLDARSPTPALDLSGSRYSAGSEVLDTSQRAFVARLTEATEGGSA